MTRTTVPTVADRPPYSDAAYVNTKLAILACNTTLGLAEKTADILLRALARQVDEFFPDRPPALTRGALDHPSSLVDALLEAAKHHGVPVVTSTETYQAAERVAELLLQLLIVPRPPYCVDCKHDPNFPDHPRCGEEGCGCPCNWADEGPSEDRAAADPVPEVDQ